MRAIDHDDPVWSRAEMEKPRVLPPTDQEVDDLVSVLRKQHAHQKVDLHAEPTYGRSIEVELFIVEDWRASRQIKPEAQDGDEAGVLRDESDRAA